MIERLLVRLALLAFDAADWVANRPRRRGFI